MVAVASRLCRVCTAPLPDAPIARYYTHEECGWEPSPGPQTEFLSSSAFEVGYGGAAGGAKSESLLMDPLRDVNKAPFRGLLLRRTIREMRRSLIDRALTGWYNKIAPGGFVGSPSPLWRFPSGAVIEFGNLENEKDLENYQSAEYQYIGFDELCHFTESMYTYMMSRLRSSSGIRSRVRAGFNPPADMTGAWVVKRFAPWVDRGPDYHGVRARSGQTLYVVNSRSHGERYVEKGTLDEEGNPAQARVFIQARIADNPYIAKKDPTYKSRLLGLDPVTCAQLLDGDFSRIDKPGALWDRAILNAGRVTSHPDLWRIGVSIDPSGSHRKGSDEAGIIAGGMGPCFCSGKREDHAFVTTDLSGVFPALEQATRTVNAYNNLTADFAVAEINYGGEWVETTLKLIDPKVNVQVIHVSKGKVVRAEPVRALYGKLTADGELEGCKVHHVGTLAGVENEQCTYDPRVSVALSPGRMDALVFLLSKLLLEAGNVDGITSTDKRRYANRARSFMP